MSINKVLCAVVLSLGIVVLGSAQAKTVSIWVSENDVTVLELLDAYAKAHPDVKLDVFRKGGDYKQELGLALKSGDAPDILSVSQLAGEMGVYANQKLIVPLTAYADKYGWNKGLPQSFLKTNLWDVKTKQLGIGTQYVAAHVIEFAVIGYNKALFKKAGIDKTPTTWDELEADNAKLAKAGITPFITGIAGGDGWVAIHQVATQMYRYMTRDQIDKFVFTMPGASLNLPGAQKGLENVQKWVKNGWYNKGFEGVGWDDSLKMFMAGQGAMFLSGSWISQDFTRLGQEVKTDWDFFAVPSPYVFGTVATGLSIASSSKNPDLAADVINFIMQDYKVHLKWNNLPLNLEGVKKDSSVQLSPQFRNLLTILDQIKKNDGIAFYPDMSTPGAYDAWSAHGQNLMGLKETPADFLKAMDKDLQKYLATKSK